MITSSDALFIGRCTKLRQGGAWDCRLCRNRGSTRVTRLATPLWPAND